jgi:hypothetical protein
MTIKEAQKTVDSWIKTVSANGKRKGGSVFFSDPKALEGTAAISM